MTSAHNIADWLILRLTPSIFAYPL